MLAGLQRGDGAWHQYYLADRVEQHMAQPLPLVGSGEPVEVARKALQEADALMVVDDGKPIGVLTRHDLLGFVAR